MRIKDDISASGYFWLPHEPNNKLAGVLTIKDGGEAELSLIGTFETGMAALTAPELYPKVEGIADELNNVVLLNCIRITRNIRFGTGLSKTKLHVGLVFAQCFSECPDETKFNRMAFQLEGLDLWHGISGIRVGQISFEGRSEISYEFPEQIELWRDDNRGYIVSVIFAFKPPGLPAYTEAGFKQWSYVQIESSAGETAQEFVKLAHQLRLFFSFAIDRLIGISDVSLGIPDTSEPIPTGKKRWNSMRFYYPSVMHPEQAPKADRHAMLFRYDEVRESIQSIISAWLTINEKVGVSLSLYFSVQSGAHRFLNSKFLALAQAVETFHRRMHKGELMPGEDFAKMRKAIIEACPEAHRAYLSGRLINGNEISLAERIRRMISPFESYFGDGETRDDLVKQIKDARNYYTHYDPKLENKVEDGSGLWDLVTKLEAIFQFALLKELGFTGDQVDKMVKNSNHLQYKLGDKK